MLWAVQGALEAHGGLLLISANSALQPHAATAPLASAAAQGAAGSLVALPAPSPARSLAAPKGASADLVVALMAPAPATSSSTAPSRPLQYFQLGLMGSEGVRALLEGLVSSLDEREARVLVQACMRHPLLLRAAIAAASETADGGGQEAQVLQEGIGVLQHQGGTTAVPLLRAPSSKRSSSDGSSTLPTPTTSSTAAAAGGGDRRAFPPRRLTLASLSRAISSKGGAAGAAAAAALKASEASSFPVASADARAVAVPATGVSSRSSSGIASPTTSSSSRWGYEGSFFSGGVSGGGAAAIMVSSMVSSFQLAYLHSHGCSEGMNGRDLFPASPINHVL